MHVITNRVHRVPGVDTSRAGETDFGHFKAFLNMFSMESDVCLQVRAHM